LADKRRTTSASVYESALKILALRARSIAELRRKLLQKGNDPAKVDAVIAQLRDQRLLDDADYAREFARAKIVGAGASRRRILMELARKGVSRTIAEKAVEELPESEGVDPSSAIRRVAEKKWKSLAKLGDVPARRRLYAFLARRGFNPDEIRDVMTALGKDDDR
jgi:regulatory protein